MSILVEIALNWANDHEVREEIKFVFFVLYSNQDSSVRNVFKVPVSQSIPFNVFGEFISGF